MMYSVYLSLGSNIHRYSHIGSALNLLEAKFGVLVCSPVYESQAVGFEGDDFLNMVVGIETSMDVFELSAWIKRVEDQHGRDRSGSKYSARTLDIDILTFGDLVGQFGEIQLPRQEILFNAFVLRPFCDIQPNLIHPETGHSLSKLWTDFNKESQALWPVEFNRS